MSRKYRRALGGVVSLLALAMASSTVQAHQLHDCAARLDKECLRQAHAGVDDIDLPDDQGSSPFLLAVQTALNRKATRPGELAAIQYLFGAGADKDLEQVQAILRLAPDQTTARAIRSALSQKSLLSLRRESQADLRIMKELNISAATLGRARDNLERLRQSGRFQDYYVAYAVSRSVDDAKKAQSLARNDEEKRALEHMALLTVPDANDIFSPSLAVDAASLKPLRIPETGLLDLQRLGPDRDLTLFVKVRQPPQALVKLTSGKYRVHLSLDLRFYPSPEQAKKAPESYLPLSLPVAVPLEPPYYTGAAELRLSELRQQILAKVRSLGAGEVFSEKIDLQISRIERLQ